MTSAVDAGLAPQRPRESRDRSEPEGFLMEPEWTGTRALVRVGHAAPHFVGYGGPVDAPRELYEAISTEAQCGTAVIDGVLVEGFEDEAELEADAEGNAYVRPALARTIFAAFDLLEADGVSLLDVPLLERKRHLEGILRPSANVRMTAYRTRDLRAWRETLLEQGFKRVVLKALNSPYSPGATNDHWLVVTKIKDAGRR